MTGLGLEPNRDPAGRPEGRVRRIFCGAEGLRPGWGAALYVAMIGAMGGLTFVILHYGFHVHPNRKAPMGPGALVLNEAVAIVFTMGATLIMGRIEGRRIWRYGFGLDGAGRLYALGLAVGFPLLSLVVAVEWAAGGLHFDGVLLHGVAIPVYALWVGLGFVLVGISEEAMFRGYFFNALTRAMGFWPASLLVSALFGLSHMSNPGENPLGIANVVLASLFFCVLLRATGSLWCGMGVHAAWDWAQSFFYGVPDSSLMFKHHLLASHATGPVWLSGGKDGPEGTAISVVVLALGTAWLALRPRAGAPASA